MTICDLCRRPKKVCESFPITDEEKVALRRMGESNPPDAYHYCRPCLRILRDPASAERILRGAIEMTLRRAGVHDPEARARRFSEALAAKAHLPKKP